MMKDLKDDFTGSKTKLKKNSFPRICCEGHGGGCISTPDLEAKLRINPHPFEVEYFTFLFLRLYV